MAKKIEIGLAFFRDQYSLLVDGGETPVMSPRPPSPPCTKPPEDETNCPTLDINDTKTFTDYYSFPPITLIDDLEVWDEEDEEET